MKEKIYVIGDSHARSFSFNENFIPMFLGAGKEINFTTAENAKKVHEAVVKLLNKIEAKATVLFFFGEPDTRFYLGCGWQPWDMPEKSITGFEIKVKASMERYKFFLNKIKTIFQGKLFVLNVIPSSRILQNTIVDFYNLELEKICKEETVGFVSINDEVYLNDEHAAPKQEYISEHVHLNNNIQPLVEKKLIQFGMELASGHQKEIQWSNTAVQGLFRYDEKFGCYKMS